MSNDKEREALMALVDDYAEASFDQGLHRRTEDPAPEAARAKLDKALRDALAGRASLAASAGSEPVAPWWRKRADEIELQVARTGSAEAMRCYTDMRTLLQAAATPTAPVATKESVPVAWRHNRTLCLYDTQEEVPLADGDEWAEPLYLEPNANTAGIAGGSWDHLKLMMEHSAFGGELQLSDALANIDDFATHPSPPEGMVGGWRPIETAPKDGTLILVHFGTKGVRAVSWDSPFHDEVTEENGIWCVDDDKHGPYGLRGYLDGHPSAPTHWMPLPAPPLAVGCGREAG